MSDDSVNRELEAMRAEYRESLPARLARIESLRLELAGGAAAAARIAELYREVHSIAGSGRTFGYPALTDAARAAEAFLEPYRAGAAPGAADWARLRPLLEALERALPPR